MKRDFQKGIDHGGPEKAIGEEGLVIPKKVFKAWHDFRGGGCSRGELQVRLLPVARKLDRLLEHGRACADTAAAEFCANYFLLIAAFV